MKIKLEHRGTLSVVSYLMGISSHRNTEGAREAKISELQVITVINQQVLRFQVAVQDTMRVTVEESRIQLVSKFLCKPVSIDCSGESRHETRDVCQLIKTT